MYVESLETSRLYDKYTSPIAVSSVSFNSKDNFDVDQINNCVAVGAVGNHCVLSWFFEALPLTDKNEPYFARLMSFARKTSFPYEY